MKYLRKLKNMTNAECEMNKEILQTLPHEKKDSKKQW
jgi:hypothetical protein